MNKVRVEVFGKTYGFRNQLKSMGLYWNSDKKLWTSEISIERIDEIKKFISDKHDLGYTIYGQTKETKLPSVKPKPYKMFTPIMGRGRESIAYIDTLETDRMRKRQHFKGR